jgi:hypothetical protein
MEKLKKTIEDLILDINTQADVKLKLEKELNDLKKKLIDGREHGDTDDDANNQGSQCNK